MSKSKFKVYNSRWVMLVVYMLMAAVNQLLWITFAPITGDATKYFGVSDLKIGLLSMCFMIVYIVVSIPASWAIDKFGIRIGVGIGAVFTGIFGLLRGFAGTDYNLLLMAQIGIAIGQPFILNSITKLAARWSNGRTGYCSRPWNTFNVYRYTWRNDPYPLPDTWIRDKWNAGYIWSYINCYCLYFSCSYEGRTSHSSLQA